MMIDKIKILILSLLVIIGSGYSYAQTPLEGTPRNEALLNILSSYTGWSSVELEGNLDIPNLPMGIKPSMKIYMKNGESVMLSVRAPFMGEVARGEISSDSIMIANKMKRTYCKESLRYLLKGFPASIADLQSLLLCRIALLGQGELTVENSVTVSLIKAQDESVMVVPIDSEQPENAEYGYLTGAGGRLQALLVSITGNQVPVSLIYDYLISGGYSLSLDIPDSKISDISMEIKKPRWGASPFSSFRPDKNYTRLSIPQFIKSF